MKIPFTFYLFYDIIKITYVNFKEVFDLAEKKKKQEFLLYHGKPLIRNGNILYYGNPEDKYIIMMTVNQTEAMNDLQVATDVTVTLQTNSGSGKEKVLKKVDREGLYRALDLAEVWLENALEDDPA